MHAFLLFTLLLSSSFLYSQEVSHPLPNGAIVLRAADYNSGTVVGPPEGFVPGQERAATINVNYTGFTTAACSAEKVVKKGHISVVR